ncbi:hypothetical protein D9M70_448230 [compost metagenome]
MKARVTDGKRLVHHQELRVHMHCHRKGQTDEHAARICLDGLIDKIANLGECLDLRKYRIDFCARQAENRRIQIDILTSAELEIEAGSQLEQRRDTPIDLHRAVGLGQRAANDL